MSHPASIPAVISICTRKLQACSSGLTQFAAESFVPSLPAILRSVVIPSQASSSACFAAGSRARRFFFESRSGGNPGEKQVRAVACHRGIHCTNSSASKDGFGRSLKRAGLTAVHDIGSGDAKSTRDSSERRSPAGTHRQRPAPYASKRDIEQLNSRVVVQTWKERRSQRGSGRPQKPVMQVRLLPTLDPSRAASPCTPRLRSRVASFCWCAA